jgi:hypothetical protein
VTEFSDRFAATQQLGCTVQGPEAILLSLRALRQGVNL